MSDVERVLAGQADYDDLPEDEQAIVSAEWSTRIAVRLRSLNFEPGFMAVGKPYSEIDEHGRAVLRHPATDV